MVDVPLVGQAGEEPSLPVVDLEAKQPRGIRKVRCDGLQRLPHI